MEGTGGMQEPLVGVIHSAYRSNKVCDPLMLTTTTERRSGNPEISKKDEGAKHFTKFST